MTAVHIQTASKLYTITGVGYAPNGVITAATAGPAATAPPPVGADADPKAAAVAAATAAMAAESASGQAGPEVQVELGDAELAALRGLLEGAVLCNDSALNVVQDEATGALNS